MMLLTTYDDVDGNYMIMIMKKKLDKDIVHYYNFLIQKLYPYKGVRRNRQINDRIHL
jgi:hypothetical protein